MADAWEEYAEAIDTLDRAPRAARDKLTLIERRRQDRHEAANQAFGQLISQRQQLERRLSQLAGLGDKILAEHDIADGPATKVPVVLPNDVAGCLATLDRLERQLHDELERLLAARRRLPEPLPDEPPKAFPWLAVLVAAGAVLAIVLVIVLIV